VPPPDLVSFHVVHRGMRNDSARLAKAIAELDEPDRTWRSRRLGRWYEGFVGELYAHHAVEDELFFPALRRRVPVFEYRLGRIDAEHAHLDAALDRTRRAIERLGDTATEWVDASRQASATTAELHELLDRHVSFADDHVLPLFSRHLSEDEYDSLEARAAGYVSFGQLPFTISWIMDNAEPAERRSLLAASPPGVKLMWYLTRRRYRRLVDEAFGAGRRRRRAQTDDEPLPDTPTEP
jgi:hypothetical protein